MHPGPMNRGVEIDSLVADDYGRSVIREQMEMASPCGWRCWKSCRPSRPAGRPNL